MDTEGSVYLYAQWEYNVTAPVAGTITAKASGENANTSTEFEQVTVSWSGFKAGTNNPISHYEIWFQESTDNKNWADRERVKNVNTTATSGSTTIGTVNHTTSSSDWGTRADIIVGLLLLLAKRIAISIRLQMHGVVLLKRVL